MTLLGGLSGDASQPLALLPVLTAEERELVSMTPNQTAAPYSSNLCVHQLFERQAADTPSVIALECEGESLTYAELDARVNKLTRYLVSTGVLRGEVLGIYMERSVDLVVSLLATWKAGATYIPLDPTFPTERLKMVFEDLHQPTILTQSRLAADLPSAGTRILCVDERWPVIELEDASSLDLKYDPIRRRLRHLYLRFDRSSQGCRGHPGERRQPAAVHGEEARHDRRRRLGCRHYHLLRHRRP